MRQCRIQGIHRRRKRGLTHRDRDALSSDDLVNWNFDPDQPNRLCVIGVTAHQARDGKIYLAAVIDAYSRRVVGWSIADHIRAELVADALQMATWRRQPKPGQTVAHSDHGSQGELNGSSQHLDDGGVVDGNEEGAGAAGAAVSGTDPIAGCADGRVAGGSCPVLGSDCPRCEDRRCCGRGGRHPPSGIGGSDTLGA